MKQVFIHGLGQTPASWEKTISKLAAGQETFCPDLPALIKGKKASYQNLYQALAQLCNRFDGPVDLCGLSLGGVLALNYAVDHPEKTNSLVLIAAQYKMPKKLLQFQNILFYFMPKSIVQKTGFEKNELIRLCASMVDLDFSKSLFKILCPTMIICGENDKANTKASAELAENIANAELRILAGSGHEINVEAPDKLAELLQAFYNKTR